MFKKNLFLLCALTSVSATIIADTFHKEDTVDVAKNKKCCRCRSLTVKNNASVGGNLMVAGSETVGGPVTAQSFITASGGPLLNWAVFSNTTEVVAPSTIFPWAATPATSVTAGIMNAAGAITLPVGGTFLVQYTAKVTVIGPPIMGEVAIVELLQGSTGGGFVNIGQPAVIAIEDFAISNILQSQITGYAIVTTTSTANNQIKLVALLGVGYSIDETAIPDANANMTILQLA